MYGARTHCLRRHFCRSETCLLGGKLFRELVPPWTAMTDPVRFAPLDLYDGGSDPAKTPSFRWSAGFWAGLIIESLTIVLKGPAHIVVTRPVGQRYSDLLSSERVFSDASPVPRSQPQARWAHGRRSGLVASRLPLHPAGDRPEGKCNPTNRFINRPE